VSSPTLGPTQSPVQWVLGALSLGVKRLGHEGDHSPPSSVEINRGGALPPLPHIFSWHSALLIKHSNSFTFYFVICYLKIVAPVRNMKLCSEILITFLMCNCKRRMSNFLVLTLLMYKIPVKCLFYLDLFVMSNCNACNFFILI
jgi:hypothetical protein